LSKTRVNSDIKARKVLLIREDGQKLGVFLTKDAIQKAGEEGLDLIQVSADQDVPVCKMGDYGKIQYDMKKRKKKSNSTKTLVKEVRLGATTEENDVSVRLKAANNFLAKGHHVRFRIKVKGRANAHKGLVVEKLNEILERVEGGKVEKSPSFSGNICTALVVPD